MSPQLDRRAAKAKADRKVRFTSLAHVLTPAFRMDTWRQLNRRGASGIDGATTQPFKRERETRVQDIGARLQAGTYRAPPVRRVAIPKELAGRVPGRWAFRQSKIDGSSGRWRGFSKRCSRETSSGARTDFGRDEALSRPCGRGEGPSSRSRSDISSRPIFADASTRSTISGGDRWWPTAGPIPSSGA